MISLTHTRGKICLQGPFCVRVRGERRRRIEEELLVMPYIYVLRSLFLPENKVCSRVRVGIKKKETLHEM